MNTSDIGSVLERQLLLQFGDRLKKLRQAKGVGTVDMAAQAGISRNTLRAIECGDPTTAIGTYLRVMSILGIGGELALLAGDTLLPPPAGTAAARSHNSAPMVQIRVSADPSRHRLQDLQSWALHEEAVKRAKLDPRLVQKAKSTALRWLASGDSRSASLWRDWVKILDAKAWRKVLGRTRHAQQLRQASPLITVLPEDVRQKVRAQVSSLEHGLELDSEPGRRAEKHKP